MKPFPVKIFLVLLFPAGSAAADSETVWLDSLELARMSSGWGRTQANQAVTKKPLSIGGRRYDRGAGTHAPSTAYMDLDGKGLRFWASCGVDDGAGAGKGSVVFRILADGRKVYQSPLLRSGMPAEKIELDVRGVRLLVLKVLDGGDGHDSDYADWAEARFEMEGGSPRLIRALHEEPVILTPPPPPEPRLNGPTIYGCRPGAPFLYRIPATGERPMTFAAEGLPSGLHLDPATGILTGAVEVRGTYRVTLSARNARGRAERLFRIVCGDTLALTPYMGWNSWYIWENHVTEKRIREAADAMVSTGLADVGFSYVCV
ncbi:MAG: NPCBM/NEW2 domain-containing protein, partial [Planctomycetota bacterium]